MYDKDYLETTLQTALGDSKYYHIPMGITRYDYAKMHGWWVRIHHDEVQFQELFYDSQHQSISEGLKAAIEYRHEVLSSLPLEKKIKTANFKTVSPIPDERIHRKIEKGVNQPYICWKTTWYDESYKVRTKRFSVLKYGENEAKNMALEHTKKHHNKTPKPLVEMASIDPYLHQKFKSISREDVEVLASINSGPYRNKEQEIAQSNPFAFEGQKHLKLHMEVERNKKLRDAKVSDFLSKNGAIYCEVCLFRFTETYSFLESDIIEVHHIVPLSKLTKSTKVTINDLILLCANCHLAIHQGDAENNLLLAMELFTTKNTNK